MSDYWKSTPKYWCDRCSVFVRDTKLEKANHESTAKHQNNLSKFLRNIHKENEREERDKQRAKDEIARLNGTAAPTSSSPAAKATASGSQSGTGRSRDATIEERKRQIAQLAAMGVAVPDEYRKDMAMAGDWQVVNRKTISRPEPEMKGESTQPKAEPTTSGTKRSMHEAELDQGEPGRKRPAWGSTEKTYRGTSHEDGVLDALLDTTMLVKKMADKPDSRSQVKLEPQPEIPDGNALDEHARIKTEPANEGEVLVEQQDGNVDVKPGPVPQDDGTEVIFKKRKTKTKR